MVGESGVTVTPVGGRVVIVTFTLPVTPLLVVAVMTAVPPRKPEIAPVSRPTDTVLGALLDQITVWSASAGKTVAVR